MESQRRSPQRCDCPERIWSDPRSHYEGIQVGKLEYREGAVWGNPYIRVLRSQLELYIVEELGSEYLMSKKSQTELRTISKEIADLRKKLAALEARKAELERAVKT